MSGLFNPFAEEDQEAQPSFNYYSDPLASFQPGAGRGTKPKVTGSGPRPPSGPPPPAPPQQQQGRSQPPAGVQRPFLSQPPPPSSIPPPRPPQGPPPNHHNHPGPPPMQPPPPYHHQQGFNAQQQGFNQPAYGAPWLEPGAPYDGGPGGDTSGPPYHKMQRTGPDTRFNQGRGGDFGRGPYQQGGRGRGRGGSFQRDRWNDGSQPGRGFNHDSNSSGQENMARYYKPSFSVDPWVGLMNGSVPTGKR